MPAGAAQHGFLIEFRRRPSGRRVTCKRLVASVTRIIGAAARKLEGDDIELGLVVAALRLSTNIQADNS